MERGHDEPTASKAWSFRATGATRALGIHMTVVQVVTAADERYVDQACVLARSLQWSQPDEVDLVVLGSGWSNRSIERLKESGGHRVHTRVVDPADRRTSLVKPLRYGFPAATMYGVLAPQLQLFDNVERLVYLDADTIVRDDLGLLLRRDLSTPVAAVVDAHVSLMGMPSMWRAWREEHVDPLAPYLNTGVMVIDVGSWRELGITDQVFELLAKYRLPCVDQDALNLTLRGHFDRLEPRWNLMPYHLMRLLRTSDLLETEDAIAQALSDPGIIHFHRSFLGKPWQVGCTHPASGLWREIARSVGVGRRSVSVRDLLRIVGARVAGMSSLDPRCEAMRDFRIADTV